MLDLVLCQCDPGDPLSFWPEPALVKRRNVVKPQGAEIQLAHKALAEAVARTATEPASTKAPASVMKRRATDAEQRLRKERDALRDSLHEHAEELSDALAQAELAEQRLDERPVDDETEQL